MCYANLLHFSRNPIFIHWFYFLKMKDVVPLNHRYISEFCNQTTLLSKKCVFRVSFSDERLVLS